MDKCAECKHAIYSPDPDRQLGHEGEQFENWKCGHPDETIRIKSKQKGWDEKCPEFNPIEQSN